MSLYNLLFGINSHTPILLAVLGLKENDVERLRNVFVSEDGTKIEIYTRTGGGNRDDYPQMTMRHLPTWISSSDDDFDETYCTDKFSIPEEFIGDVKNLSNVFKHGLRPEFMQHIAITLRREPTEGDKNEAVYAEESAILARTKHFMANGHTFVPMDDDAMKAALEIAEKNEGKLRASWGIAPISITVKHDFIKWPNAQSENFRKSMTRVEVDYDSGWSIDETYWKHCQDRWLTEFPLTMANIAKTVEQYRKKVA